jgi:hypothetical protein
VLATALFLKPVPPPRGPGLPRTIRLGERALWRTYGTAVRVRDALRGTRGQAPDPSASK